MMKNKHSLLAAVCGLGLLVGVSRAQIAIRIGPPPPVREVVPPPPPEHRDWAWHGGYHRWDGQRYVWVPGVYEAPPHPHARWVAGHWRNTPRGWVWIEGHWR